MFKLLTAIGNPFVKLLLRSPLHFLTSGTVMLITVTGRRSGRRYTTPVNYVRESNAVTAVTLKQRIWWRNLRGGAPVKLHIRGKSLDGLAEPVVRDHRATEEALESFYGRVSPIKISAERVARLAPKRVMIRIRLDPKDGKGGWLRGGS